MLAGQGLAIHFPAEQYIALERPGERDRSAEMHFGSFFRTTICADKFNVFGVVVDPGKLKTSVNEHPFHPALLMTSFPQVTSFGTGLMAVALERRLPAHCRVAVIALAGKRSVSSMSVNSQRRLTSPPSVSRKVERSSSGISLWIRRKKSWTGVANSSMSRSSGGPPFGGVS